MEFAAIGSGVLLGRLGHLITGAFGKLELTSLLSRSASTGLMSGFIWSVLFSPVVNPVYTPGHVIRTIVRPLSLRALVLSAVLGTYVLEHSTI